MPGKESQWFGHDKLFKGWLWSLEASDLTSARLWSHLMLFQLIIFSSFYLSLSRARIDPGQFHNHPQWDESNCDIIFQSKYTRHGDRRRRPMTMKIVGQFQSSPSVSVENLNRRKLLLRYVVLCCSWWASRRSGNFAWKILEICVSISGERKKFHHAKSLKLNVEIIGHLLPPELVHFSISQHGVGCWRFESHNRLNLDSRVSAILYIVANYLHFSSPHMTLCTMRLPIWNKWRWRRCDIDEEVEVLLHNTSGLFMFCV